MNIKTSQILTIAGIKAEVFSVLPAEDQAFLRMLEGAGITLDAIYEKIPKNEKGNDS